jgi:ribA/ribD-fused uncharacterized protein
MTKILFYEDKYYLFSNFSAHAVEYKGKLYPTSEHAYQAAKFDSPEIVEEIRSAKSPSEAKYLSNVIYKDKKRRDWEDIKSNVMYEIVREKIKQHEEVRSVLLATGNDEIIENSPVDYFWGCGKDRTGQNQMGQILMKIRDELKEK